jgi:hypothetical protein
MVNCSRCGGPAAALTPIRGERVCGGCLDVAMKQTDPEGLAAKVDLLEHQLTVIRGQYDGAVTELRVHLARIDGLTRENADLRVAYRGALALQNIAEKEVERCRSTATSATPAATS